MASVRGNEVVLSGRELILLNVRLVNGIEIKQAATYSVVNQIWIHESTDYWFFLL